MRIERELMRGAGPVAVLKLLERADMYGYELVQALGERSAGVLAMGQSTLYPMLYNLEAKGLVRSRWDATSSARRRKYYGLTDTGRRRLAADTAQWRAMAGAMEAIGILTSPRGGREDRMSESPALPDDLERLVRTTSRRARLWPRERADVAEELAAHFADGLAAGRSAEELARSFGDPRDAARLIGRARRRHRPRAWKVLRGSMLAITFLVALYVLAGVRLLLTRPAPSVDYLHAVNTVAAAVPEAERGWPLYREALLELEPSDLLDATGPVPRPGDAGWDEAAAYLDANAAALDLIRRGAGRGGLGFTIVEPGAAPDPVLWPEPDPAPTYAVPTLYSVRLPHVTGIRKMARLLAIDAHRAAADGRGAMAVEDVAAIAAMAEHVREVPFVICDLVGFWLVGLAVETAGAILADRPSALTDEDLRALAHRLAIVDRSLTARFHGERMGFADLIQNMYTDDGDGDGHLTVEGVRFLDSMSVGTGSNEAKINPLLLPLFNAIDVGRAEMLATYDRLIAELERNAARPRWEWEDTHANEIVERWKASRIDNARYRPIVLLMPALGRLADEGEQVHGRRDGVLVAIALELHRRRHGAWPEDLDALVPGLLPEVPADRVDGRPVRYALVDGAPVVYSIGVDRDDDGGAAVVGDSVPQGRRRDGAARYASAAQVAAARKSRFSNWPPDGDWILWPRERSPR